MQLIYCFISFLLQVPTSYEPGSESCRVPRHDSEPLAHSRLRDTGAGLRECHRGKSALSLWTCSADTVSLEVLKNVCRAVANHGNEGYDEVSTVDGN